MVIKRKNKAEKEKKMGSCQGIWEVVKIERAWWEQISLKEAWKQLSRKSKERWCKLTLWLQWRVSEDCIGYIWGRADRSFWWIWCGEGHEEKRESGMIPTLLTWGSEWTNQGAYMEMLILGCLLHIKVKMPSMKLDINEHNTGDEEEWS